MKMFQERIDRFLSRRIDEALGISEKVEEMPEYTTPRMTYFLSRRIDEVCERIEPSLSHLNKPEGNN